MSFEYFGKALKNMIHKYASDNKHKFPVLVGMDIVSCTTRKTEYHIEWTASAKAIA